MIEFNPKNIKRWMMMSTRNAFGAFLTEVAANHPELFALTADFTKSTGQAARGRANTPGQQRTSIRLWRMPDTSV